MDNLAFCVVAALSTVTISAAVVSEQRPLVNEQWVVLAPMKHAWGLKTSRLPNYRDCAALASNGELKLSELARYKTQYIDAIYKAITAKPAYKAIRVVAIVEPDSL